MEGDRGRDRVRRCCLLTSIREGMEGDHGRVECNGAAFFMSFQKKVHTRNCSFKDFSKVCK